MRTQLVTIAALVAVASIGGVAGAMIGQGGGATPTTVPTAPNVGVVQHPATPTVVTTPAPVTRTVTVVKTKPAKERPVTDPQAEQPTGWVVPDEPDTEAADTEPVIKAPAPVAPVHAVEPAPTPGPTAAPLYADQSDGITSMNGTPDPQVGTLPTNPNPTPVPPSK